MLKDRLKDFICWLLGHNWKAGRVEKRDGIYVQYWVCRCCGKDQWSRL